jgi:hypothetical protein
MPTRTKTAWDLHLDEYRKKHPDVKFSEAMKLASATYTKKNPDAKPRAARTQSQKTKAKIKKLEKSLAKLAVAP